MILAIKTDNPEAELYLLEGKNKIAEIKWQGHRQLSATLHQKINAILKDNSVEYQDLDGIAFYKGPGSFTGLRIGASVVNAFSYALSIPIVAVMGDNWIENSVKKINSGENHVVIQPYYGRGAHITAPKK